MSSSAIVVPFLAHNRSVKAWCFTSNHKDGSTTTQASFDTRNFIDGYNLRLDAATQTANQYVGALKFSFITPMTDTNYKVFVSVYGNASPLYPQMAHALNSSVYPKTVNSFWVRVGFLASVGTGAPVASGRTNNQVTNIALWDNSNSNLGVVVF